MKALLALLLSIALMALGTAMPVAAASAATPTMASCPDMPKGQAMAMDASCDRCCLTVAPHRAAPVARPLRQTSFATIAVSPLVAWSCALDPPPPRA